MTRLASQNASSRNEKMNRRTKGRRGLEVHNREAIEEQARGLAALSRAHAAMESAMEHDNLRKEQRPDIDERPIHWAQHAYTRGSVQQQNEQLWVLQRLQHDQHLRDANQGTLTKTMKKKCTGSVVRRR